MQPTTVGTEAVPAASMAREEQDIVEHAEAIRPREELTALLIGFGTGLTIAFVFLVYIVFDIAKWLP